MSGDTFSFEEAQGSTKTLTFADRSKKPTKLLDPEEFSESVMTQVKGALPEDPAIMEAILAAAEEFGVPAEYGLALAQQESGYKLDATNPSGADGLFQFIPATAEGHGLRHGVDTRDALKSARAAMKDFAEQMEKGGPDWAIKHHFAGPNERLHGSKTKQYLADVSRRAEDIRALLGERAPKTVEIPPEEERFSFEEAYGGDIPKVTPEEVAPEQAGYADTLLNFADESLGYAKDAMERGWTHVRNRFLTDMGQISPEDPNYSPVRGVDDPFAETRDLRRRKANAENAKTPVQGFVANLENPIKLLTEDSLPANFLEAASRSGEHAATGLVKARQILQQEEIVANPQKYPAVSVEAARKAIAARKAKQKPGVSEIWEDLKQAATEDPGRFGAQFVNALMADPEMLLAPAGLGAKVIEGTRRVATGATAASRATQIADKIIDAGSTGAALNLGIELASAGAEGRVITPAEAQFAAGIGFAASGAFGIFARGAEARAKVQQGNVTSDTLEEVMRAAAQEELAAETVLKNPNPTSAVVKHQIEEAAGVKFESDADLKQYLKTSRAEWKKLFTDRDLNGQYQKYLAEERMARREQLAAEGAEREVRTAAEQAKQSSVEAAFAEQQAARTLRFQQEFEQAKAARDAAEAGKVEGAAIAEDRVRELASKLDEQELFEAAFDGDVPAVKRAMNSVMRRDAELRRPKWQRGDVDPKLLARLGVGGLLAGTAYAVSPEKKLEAAFAGGLAGLMLPGGGSVLRRLAQSGATTVDGDIVSLLVRQGKLRVIDEVPDQMAKEAKLISAAKSGDQNAYKELYTENFPRIQRYVKKQIGGIAGRLAITPDDVAQEVFIDAFQQLDKFSGDVPFSAYLTRIAKNKSVDAIRSAQTAKGGKDTVTTSMYSAGGDFGDDASAGHITEGATPLVKAEVEMAASELDTPELQAMRRETEGQLLNIINSLPEKQRLAVILAKVEQYSTEEVAKIMGETPENARKLISRAQDAITEGLAKGYGAKKIVSKAEVVVSDNRLTGADGNPIKLYHGNGSRDFGFSADRQGSHTGDPMAKEGFFFTDDRALAEDYAYSAATDMNYLNPGSGKATVHEVNLLMRNPKIVDGSHLDMSQASYDKVLELIKNAKQDGHDGFIVKNWDDGNGPNNQYIVFKSSQIVPAKRGRGRPRKQVGEVDPRMLKAGAVVGIGALAGGYLNEQNSLLGAGIGALAAGALLSRGRKGKSTAQHLREGADYTLGITSTRIMNKSKALWRRAIEHERVVLRDTHRYLQAVDPFLVRLQKLPKETRDVLSRAILTGKPEVTNRLLQAIGDQELIRNWADVRSTLDSIGDQLVDLRRFQRKELDYFPRVVKDVDGLLKALGRERASFLEEAIKAADEKAVRARGTGLTELEKSLIINKVLRDESLKSQQPGFAKNRAVEEITPELQEFYATPTESLHSYIRGAVEDINRAKFFGKDLQVIKKGGKEYTNVDTSIGNLVQNLMNEGKLTGKDAEEVASLLKSRFINGERAPHEVIQASKNLSYAGLLGNPVSATTQLGDAIIQAYVQDIRSTLSAVVRTLTGRKVVNMKDFGLVDHIAEEFVSTSRSTKFVNKAFKWGLFKAVDEFGKNVALNAAVLRFSRLARTESGIAKIASKYEDALAPGELDQLIKDLQKGEPTDLVRSVAFAELSRTQPITRLELPQAYLDHPNGRLLYQYKTFMLKQIDLARRDGYNEIKAGRIAKGTRQLAELGIMLGLAGTTTQAIKDFLLGKELDLSFSNIPMNMLKTFGLSEYVLDHALGVSKEEAAVARDEGNTSARAIKPEPFQTAVGVFAPPAAMFDHIVTGDPRALRYIPWAGPFLHEQYKLEQAEAE